MARTRRRRSSSRRRRTRRNPSTRRRQPAALRAYWAKHKRGRKARGSRSGKSRGSRRSRRTRAGRRRRGFHFRTYKTLSRKYGPRRAAKKWRRGRKYIRSNPFGGLLPTFGSITGVVKDGLGIGAGWVLVNGAMMLLDKVGLGTLKASQTPTVSALINFGARAILTGVVAKLGARFLKLNGRNLALGGAFNTVYHGVQDVIAANPSAVPAAAMPLLLGYDGVSDYMTYPGMNDYMTSPRMAGLPYNQSVGDGGCVVA